MARLNVNPTLGPADGGPFEPAFEIVRVPRERREAAVARLLDAEQEPERVEGFLLNTATDGTDLSHLWASVPVGEPAVAVNVCLALCGAGRTAAMFLSGESPVLRTRAGEEIRLLPETTLSQRALLIEAACRGLETGGAPAVLAQALLGPAEADVLAAYTRAGFVRLAELAFLRRTVARQGRGRPGEPAGVSLVAVAELAPGEARVLLREALSRSYEQTLDCPALCGMRTIDDVIDSHRAVGKYDPRWWWLAMAGGSPVGCVLLNLSADGRHCELVYVGVALPMRGRGLGAELLRYAIARLGALGGVEELGCAVDTGNAPALRLYERAKFTRVQSRVAVVRPLGRGTR